MLLGSNVNILTLYNKQIMQLKMKNFYILRANKRNNRTVVVEYVAGLLKTDNRILRRRKNVDEYVTAKSHKQMSMIECRQTSA